MVRFILVRQAAPQKLGGNVMFKELLMKNESYHSALHKAICKYGADNFKVYPFIEICAGSLKELKAKLNWIEIYLIAKYKTQITGYNLAAGGEGVFGNKWSENSRIKLSKTITGRKLTAEHRRKISRANKGKPSWVAGKHLSEEHKRKLSEARKGSGNPMFGRKHSSKKHKENERCAPKAMGKN